MYCTVNFIIYESYKATVKTVMSINNHYSYRIDNNFPF